MVPAGTDAELGTPGGIDDHMVAHHIGGAIGIKIIDLLPGTELDIHHFHILLRQGHDFFFHWVCSLFLPVIARSAATWQSPRSSDIP